MQWILIIFIYIYFHFSPFWRIYHHLPGVFPPQLHIFLFCKNKPWNPFSAAHVHLGGGHSGEHDQLVMSTPLKQTDSPSPKGHPLFHSSSVRVGDLLASLGFMLDVSHLHLVQVLWVHEHRRFCISEDSDPFQLFSSESWCDTDVVFVAVCSPVTFPLHFDPLSLNS